MLDQFGIIIIVNLLKNVTFLMQERKNMNESIVGNLKLARYIIPFSYEGNYSDACTKINFNWELRKPPDTEQDIYEYIADSLYSTEKAISESENDIGSLWVPKKGSKIRLPRLLYIDSVSNEQFKIYSHEIGLSIFRNGIGFVWYDISLRHMDTSFVTDADIIINFQNKFKELNRKSNISRIVLEENDSSFVLGEWIENTLLADITGKRFYPGRIHCSNSGYSTKVPDKALLYTYYIAFGDMDTQELLKLNYRLSSGYDTKYKLLNSIVENCFTPFENVVWKITKEGCGCSVNTDENDSFFTRLFVDKVRNDYFILYLLLLYQSYSLLMYAEKIELKMSANPKFYLESKDNTKIQLLLAEMSTFTLKSTHTSVSHIQHQNDFYEYGMSMLRIREDSESVSAGAESLGEMQKLVEEKEKEKNESVINTALALLSVWAFFSAISDGVATVNWIFFDTNLYTNFTYRIVSFSVAMFVSFIGIIAVVYIIANKKRKK